MPAPFVDLVEQVERAGGVQGRLAVMALRCTAALPRLGPAFYADRLYRYHALPRSSVRTERADLARIAVLGGWQSDSPEGSPWLSLYRVTRPAAVRWKLYLSPPPAELYACARVALPVLADHGAVAAKLGRDEAGMSRPDRFIAYFPDRDSLAAAALALSGALAGSTALGVPFTAPIGPGGLCSYGTDLGAQRRGGALSWRQWVTQELGMALFRHAATSPGGDDPVGAALRRLAGKGVALPDFAPGPALARRSGAGGRAS